jgi:hypothetical protein
MESIILIQVLKITGVLPLKTTYTLKTCLWPKTVYGSLFKNWKNSESEFKHAKKLGLF